MNYKYKYIKYKSKYLELQNTDTNNQIGGGKMITFNNITIKNEIGKGMLGTIYLATDKNDNKYAVKIEQILKKEIKQTYKSLIWREINFAQTMNKLYPKQFMTLYDYKIDNNCTHKQNFDGFNFKLEDLPEKQQTFYKKLWKSKYCSIKLWSFVDTTLHDVLNSWNKFDDKIYYDLFIQVIYVVYLMNKHGYFHNDFHQKNIGIVYTKDKYINVIGHKILTHGMIVQAIDYGLILHKKYKLKTWEKTKLANDNDLFTILNLCVFNYTNFNYEYKKELKNVDQNKPLNISNDDYELLTIIIKHLNLTKENEKWFVNLLYKLIFYQKYQKALIGNKLKKSVPPMLMIPLNVIMYMITHVYDISKVLKYVIINRPQ